MTTTSPQRFADAGIAAAASGLRPAALASGRLPGAPDRLAPGSSRRTQRAPQPRLRRVDLETRRPPRIPAAAVASAVQFADLLVVLAGGAAGFCMQRGIGWPLPPLAALTGALVLALMTRASQNGLAQPREITQQRFFEQFIEGAVHALAAFGFALIAGMAVLQPNAAQRAPLVAWLLVWALMALVGILVVRLVLSALLARWRTAGRLKQQVAVYGTGDLAERLVQRLAACPEAIEIVGVFDDRAGRGVAGLALCQQPHGTTADLVELSRQLKIDRIVVALPHSAEKRLLEILRKLHKMPVEISLAPDMVGFNVPAKDRDGLGGVPLLDVYGRALTLGQSLVKATFDRVAAGGGIMLLAPVLLLVALAVKLDSRGPVLFRQNRYGFGDRVIQVYKFRTMRAEAADPDGTRQTETDDPRLTRIGGLLRRWSLDELPQLFNVLRGELSLVGPRPHAVSMHVRQRRNEDIVPDYALRHHVKPGITGWAQVNGYHGPVQTERALRQRVAYDLEYINHWSLWFDIRIVVKTLFIAFGQRHAY
ncbi:MAG: undecaprenyl-phosphate glucose phosphotransferase [Alphaproteobacteria bacterium]|nr:undecaprenyl-phosphate glucose phosphotransferase [Alphaproteobacteria bacterium]